MVVPNKVNEREIKKERRRKKRKREKGTCHSMFKDYNVQRAIWIIYKIILITKK